MLGGLGWLSFEGQSILFASLPFFLSIFTGSLIYEHYTRECEFGNFDKIKNTKNKKTQKTLFHEIHCVVLCLLERHVLGPCSLLGGGGGVPGTQCFGYRVPSALDTGCIVVIRFSGGRGGGGSPNFVNLFFFLHKMISK